MPIEYAPDLKVLNHQLKIICPAPQILLDDSRLPKLDTSIKTYDKRGATPPYMTYSYSIDRMLLGSAAIPLQISGSLIDYMLKPSNQFCLGVHIASSVAGQIFWDATTKRIIKDEGSWVWRTVLDENFNRFPLTQPISPLIGECWFDSATQMFKIWNTAWKFACMNGIDQTIVFEDNNRNTHTLVFTKGTLTSYSVV